MLLGRDKHTMARGRFRAMQSTIAKSSVTRCPQCGQELNPDRDSEFMAHDRRFFDEHPAERVRYRSAYPDEHPFVCDPGRPPGAFPLVRVDNLAPGMRSRSALYVFDAGPSCGDEPS